MAATKEQPHCKCTHVFAMMFSGGRRNPASVHCRRYSLMRPNPLDSCLSPSKVLSQLPDLRELNLAFNYFTGVSLKPETAECAFPLLEGLDLGFNYIESERDVVAVVILERLQRIVLYGNPLVGPTGEDPLGLCVENLIEESDR